ncbi:MAG TPA: FG-GAP-like repeat-containing protein, partial [Gemmataceae bacterium]|nr:FG-GAP-like repeat-containing protein [Gemmataceae bacterium]
MSLAWWRKLAWERMSNGASRRTRSSLRVESLEDRTTPTNIIAVGSQPGASPLVAVFDAATRSQQFTFVPYDASFTGGVNVAVGDVNGDGTPDVVTGSGAGGGPIVKVFDGRNGAELKSFTVGDEGSRSGVSVAAGDIDNDGLADIVVGGVRNGQPLIQVLKFSDGSAIRGYAPFQGVNGVSVAVGDVNADGTLDVVAGAGSGGAPHIQVFSGVDDAVLMSLLAFESTFTGGVQVSTGDLNGNGRADVLAAAGNLGGPRVQAFSGTDGAVISNFFAYDSGLRAGVSAVVVDSDNNGTLDVVTANGQNQSDFKAFNPRTLAALAAPGFNGLPASNAYDTTAPAGTLSSTVAAVSKTTPMPFKAAFTEAVNGFALTDIVVTNGTAGNLVKVDAKNYSFDITPTASGDVVVSVAAKSVTDAAGNTNAASAGFT